MTKIEDQELMKLGGPAFPFSIEFEDECCVGTQNYTGMTLRDWFAGQALSGGLIHETKGVFHDDAEEATAVARYAYGYADAMLAARNGGQ